MAALPDGWFLNDMIVWGRSFSKETIISKGVYLEVPDMEAGDVNQLIDFQDQLRVFLGMVNDDMAVQLQWTVDSDYRDALSNYKRITDEKATHPWTQYVREERHARYTYLMENGMLRRERLALFLTRKCNTIPKGGFPAVQHLDRFLAQQARNFDELIETLSVIFPESKILPMDDREHYHYIRRFANPSLSLKAMTPETRYQGFDPEASILDNCFRSDYIAFDHDDFIGFKSDDYYHSFFVLRRWPRQTMPGIMRAITSAVGQEYCVTQNLFPLSISKEIKKEEDAVVRLEGDMEHNRMRSLRVSIAKKNAKIDALMAGYTIPFNVLTVVHLWDKSVEGLVSKNTTMKTAIQAMNGCQYHHCNHPAQGKNLYIETVPGWTGGRTREWDMYAESNYLVDLLPMSSTFTGHLEDGEALYDGTMGNMVGIRTFAGNTPQNYTLIGMTGAGKSVTMTDLISQNECLYDFTAIIEEGLSYATYTQLMGKEPMVLHPDSPYTLNYFDTLGLPLTNTVIANATALCLKFVGLSQDEDKNNRRQSVINRYIQSLYWDNFEEWTKEHEDLYEDCCRRACMIERHRMTMGADSSFLDAFIELRELERENPQEHAQLMASLTDDEVLAFSKSNFTADLVRNMAFSYFKHEDYAQLTHTALVESMRFAPKADDDEEEVRYLATMLAAWTRAEGKNGRLFDGITNYTITGNLVHFELGRIPDTAKELKEAAGFLVANYIRQHIVNLPRGQKKRVIFEEVARFLNIPGSDRILAEFYSQLRKYACWCICIFQNYAQLANSPLKRVIFGNSKVYMLMRQNSREDIKDIAQETGLPSSMWSKIKDYALPEHQKGQIGAYFAYFAPGGGSHGLVCCGNVKNIVSTEVRYVAKSDGDHFDARKKALARHTDTFKGVLAEALKMEQKEDGKEAA